MKIIYVPNVSVNEDEVKLLSWTKNIGEQVKKYEMICEVETTKSTYDIEAESDGYLYYVRIPGEMAKTGEILAIITEASEENFTALIEGASQVHDKKSPPANTNIGITVRKITKKAEILARKSGIDIETIETAEDVITEEVIMRLIEATNNTTAPKFNTNTRKSKTMSEDLVDSHHPAKRQERILILGAGGGCNLVVDILARTPQQRATLILDNNQATHNKSLMGVDVAGSFTLIEELWGEGKFDAVISTIVKDNAERQQIYEDISALGIPFTNIISDAANIRLNVTMGTGNLIISGCYLAPSVTIGNNNFLAAFTSIEHHSVVGSHCTFGPRFTASGKVIIGDKCKFGTGVFVEPFVNIGYNSTIASGAILTGHIPPNSIVKTESRIQIKQK